MPSTNVAALAATVIVAALLTPAAPALAQGLLSGTPQERAYCRRDVRKFCRHVKADAGPFAFLHCLQEHRRKLSKACGKVLKSHGV